MSSSRTESTLWWPASPTRLESFLTASVNHAQRTHGQAKPTEVPDHNTILDDLARSHTPVLRHAISSGADIAAEGLIVLDDKPERIHSGSVSAELFGTSLIPCQLA